MLAPIGNKYVHQGQTLTFTASATDSDLPAQTLTFSLGAAPNGASINPSSGLFTWPTAGAPAPSTNLVIVQVADNGTPSLSDSEMVTMVVLARLNFGQLTRAGNQLTLGWDTAPGQTYRLEYKDDLGAATWTALGSDLLATGSSLSVNITITSPSHRFYRLRLVE